MTLDELQQIKDSLNKGVMIHKGKWLEVLDKAIDGESRLRAIAEVFDTIVAVDAYDEHGNDFHIDFDKVRMNLP